MDQTLQRNTLNYKTLRRNIWQNLRNTASDNDFLGMAPEARVAEKNTDRFAIF